MTAQIIDFFNERTKRNLKKVHGAGALYEMESARQRLARSEAICEWCNKIEKVLES